MTTDKPFLDDQGHSKAVAWRDWVFHVRVFGERTCTWQHFHGNTDADGARYGPWGGCIPDSDHVTCECGAKVPEDVRMLFLLQQLG